MHTYIGLIVFRGFLELHNLRTKFSSLPISKTLVLVMSAVIFLSIGSAATVASFNDSGTSTISATAGSIAPAPITLETWPWMFQVNKAYVGQTYEKTFAITNNGTIPMKYTAQVKNADINSSEILSTVPVTVMVGNTSVYTGNLGAIKIPTQTLAANSSHTLKITMKPVITNAIRDLHYMTSISASADFEINYTN